MTSEEKRMHLRRLRAHLDEHCPGWRDADVDGHPVRKIEFIVFLEDGTEERLVLHAKSSADDHGG